MNTFSIFIRTLSGKTLCVNVDSDMYTDTLLDKVSEKTNIPDCALRLLYGNKQLRAGITIGDYNILPDSTISVAARMFSSAGFHCIDVDFVYSQRTIPHTFPTSLPIHLLYHPSNHINHLYRDNSNHVANGIHSHHTSHSSLSSSSSSSPPILSNSSFSSSNSTPSITPHHASSSFYHHDFPETCSSIPTNMYILTTPDGSILPPSASVTLSSLQLKNHTKLLWVESRTGFLVRLHTWRGDVLSLPASASDTWRHCKERLVHVYGFPRYVLEDQRMSICMGDVPLTEDTVLSSLLDMANQSEFGEQDSGAMSSPLHDGSPAAQFQSRVPILYLEGMYHNDARQGDFLFNTWDQPQVMADHLCFGGSSGTGSHPVRGPKRNIPHQHRSIEFYSNDFKDKNDEISEKYNNTLNSTDVDMI